MLSQFKNPNLYTMMLLDMLLFIMSYVGACLLRFEFSLDPTTLRELRMALPFLVPAKLGVFLLFGLYRGMYRYFSIQDLWRLGSASVVSSLFVIVLMFYLHGHDFSRSVFMLDGFLTFLFTAGLRIGIRSFHSAVGSTKGKPVFSWARFAGSSSRKKNVVIVGAGSAGEKVLREIFDNPDLEYRAVGFLDDDAARQGRSLHGVPVLGPMEKLPEVVEKHGIREVFITLPSAAGRDLRRIVDICKDCNVSYKALPRLGHIMDGKVSIKALRDVNYEDLLGRPPVDLDVAGIRGYVTGQTVLVTGCGGSIGSELCRQLIAFDPGCLILVDNGEWNLFNIQMELQHELKFCSHRCVLSPVQDRRLMADVFRSYRPAVVFHAAAYKHVPLLELNPWEAVYNNIRGSQVVMELAAEYGVERFVMVSTDKAVRPGNVMGATKRISELLMQTHRAEGRRFMAVRCGNVLGSFGSVIPLFRRQIEQGGPVTVTHPDITRYFMTIPEAAQLILQAGALGEGGEIYFLEMGTPVRIADMARDLIELSGKRPDIDIEIVYTGLREGEKLYEELITVGEDLLNTRHEKIMLVRPEGYGQGIDSRRNLGGWLGTHLEDLYRIAATHDASAIKQKLKEIVPEYTPQQSQSVLEGAVGEGKKSAAGEDNP
jgi:FlaA1/EpsC-like NDP-sugar epimerase